MRGEGRWRWGGVGAILRLRVWGEGGREGGREGGSDVSFTY